MANTTTTLNANALLYHDAPAGGGKVAVKKGKCRKGKSGSADMVGFIQFKPDEIKTALSGKKLFAAQLVLTRDRATGAKAKTLGITQLMVSSVDTVGNYTHDQVIGWTYRAPHIVTVSGESCTIPLPGGMLRRFKNGSMESCCFVLYHAPEESGNDYVAFSGAQLKLVTGDTWETPVWNRPINKGDTVSDYSLSHRVDLYEIRYYIYRRADVDNVTVNIGTSEIQAGLYSTWTAIITALRAAMETCLTAEGKTATWKTLTTGDMPNAQAINELRNYLNATPASTGRQVSVGTVGCAYHNEYGGFELKNANWTCSWRNGNAPLSGKVWGKLSNGTIEYSHRFGFWFLADLLTGLTVTSLKIRLTTQKGQDRGAEDNKIRLYPIKVSALPARNATTKLGDVIQIDDVVGEATSGGVGSTRGKDFVETLDVELSASCVTKLMNGTYFGVAVDCDQVIRTYTGGATLLINGG